MADLRSFHERTDAARPANIVVKASNFLVAILKTDRQVEGVKLDSDYLWIKCHARVTVKILRQQYTEKIMPGGGFVLKHQAKALEDEEVVGALDHYLDHLIVLEAVVFDDVESGFRFDRQPLKPISQQTSRKSQTSNQQKLELHEASIKTEMEPSNSHDDNTLVRSTAKAPVNRFPTSYRPRSQSPRTPVAQAPGTGDRQFTKYVMARNVSPGHGSSIKMETFDGANDKAEAGQNLLSQVSDKSERQRQRTFQLQSLLNDATPEILENSVEEGVKLLDKLGSSMRETPADTPDAEQWIKQIENLKSQAAKTRTVIGVVGHTGAGKSSVINAVLDEERLVPTNCMRACTAVVTEISYNYGEIPYRAEIEFIQLQDWEKELKILFQDLLDTNGAVSRECANEETDAGVAYAKIKAVYPKKTKEDIANSNIGALLREVSHVLGKTEKIEHSDSGKFYKRLQHFVDSKEKSTGDKKTEKENKKKKGGKEMEYWPLIRSVRLYVKSKALSTGAVLVDLPGVHDSNAARAAVAEGYMRQTTGLWIVAPVNRAVDDKAAKSLLGDSFKRQLKMDGGFGSVTFICSKTDDISLTEAQDSLGIDDELAPLWDALDDLRKKKKSLKAELDEFKESKAAYGDAMNDIDDQLETWEALKDDIEAGKTTYRLKPQKSKKRKARRDHRPRKRQRRASQSANDSSSGSDYEDSTSSEAETEADEDAFRGDPLTEEQASTKIAEFRSDKKELRRSKIDIDDKIKEVRRLLDEVATTEEDIEAKIATACISGRNQYSKGAIQHDYAAGIKELDQELAAEENEEAFNPEEEIRDYDEVAKSLPVFCVSSRAFQKLQGRLQKDGPVPGFQNVDETEIPMLQQHASQLTIAGRTANCKRFLNSLSQLLNSLTLWASSDGTGGHLSKEQQAKEERSLASSLKKLESKLDGAVGNLGEELWDEFTDSIFDKYESAVSKAAEGAIETAFQWGAPVNRENRQAGGYYWSSYKAVCRRLGQYSNAQGMHNWNDALGAPMIKTIAPGWERSFTRRLPTITAGFVRNAINIIKTFHSEVDDRARKTGTGIAGLAMLEQQISVHDHTLKDLANTVRDRLNAAQKEINRAFIPAIQKAVGPAYETCTEESGTGSFARMKHAMTTHIEQNRIEMFESSVNSVREQLIAMLRTEEIALGEAVDHIFTSINRDYRAILGGGVHGEILPKAQRTLRREVSEIINGVEKIFQVVAGFKNEKEDDELATDSHNGSRTSQTAAVKMEDDGILTSDSGKRKVSGTVEDSDSQVVADPSSSVDEAGRMSLESDASPSTSGATEEETAASDSPSDESE